jgi:hypothetical protein
MRDWKRRIVAGSLPCGRERRSKKTKGEKKSGKKVTAPSARLHGRDLLKQGIA